MAVGCTLVEPLADVEVNVPGVMAILAAPVVAQLSVLLAPEAMLVGLAVNEPTVGLLGALLTVKLCETGVAAAYALLPACVAWMVQEPAATNVAVVPLTVQTLAVVDAKDTIKPELAVADSARGVPTVCAPGLLNVIVWDCNAPAEFPSAPRL